MSRDEPVAPWWHNPFPEPGTCEFPGKECTCGVPSREEIQAMEERAAIREEVRQELEQKYQLTNSHVLMIGIAMICAGSIIVVAIRGFAVEKNPLTWVIGVACVVWVVIGVLYDRPS